MAHSLGYKDKVTWETIQNPYVPKWMVESAQMQREYENGQLEWAKLAATFRSNMEMKSGSTPRMNTPDNPKGDKEDG